MSGWGCPHEIDGLCERVQRAARRAWCRPGMRGCVLVGKVELKDGAPPLPTWPTERELQEIERARVRRKRRL